MQNSNQKKEINAIGNNGNGRMSLRKQQHKRHDIEIRETTGKENSAGQWVRNYMSPPDN